MNASLKLVCCTVACALAVVACANGTFDDTAGMDVDLTRTVEPTEPEPPDESMPIPEARPSEGAKDDAGTELDTSDSGSSTSSSGGVSPDAGSSSGGPPDAGSCATTPPSNACGLVSQCGCASNETCATSNKTTGAVSCVVAGGGSLGSLCTTTSQCAKGLACAYGACRPYCAKDGDPCTGAGLGACGQLYDPPGTAVPNANVCTITCDLRNASDVCGANTCIWDPSLAATDCDAAGSKGEFTKCAKYNDCKANFACVSHPIFGLECERWCRIGKAGDCGAGSVCNDVYGANAPTQGADKLGHCQ